MKVAELHVYPVKGCRGIPVQAARLTPTGLPFDRHWMVVRADSGKFLTQRQLPKLCQVAVSLPPEALLQQDWGQLGPGAALQLSAPGMPPLQVPLTGGAAADVKRVTVWEWSGAAADEGDEAAAWFSSYLGTPARLVRHLGRGAGGVPADAGPTVRPTDPAFAAGHEVAFADGFPVLVVRQENLEDLNARLTAESKPPLLMNRFRPNIVLTGGAGAAWSDDAWGSISAGGAVLQYVKPCSRCKVTTIDQDSAEVGREPLATLGTFRSGKLLGWAERQRSWTHEVFFGWNAAVATPGAIAVGDAVAAAPAP